MRISDLLAENAPAKDLPPVVYHGTDSRNLTSILRRGLQPRKNRWLTQQDRKFGRKSEEVPTLSTIPELTWAIEYAKQGGSTGWNTSGGIVLGFKPLPTDRFDTDGFHHGEIVFYNTIAPERLFIAWPEKMKGAIDDRLQGAQGMQTKQLDKTNLVKIANQRLKSLGSSYKVRSIGTPNKMRVRVYDVHSDGTMTPVYRDRDNMDSAMDMDITSDEFRSWLDSLVNR